MAVVPMKKVLICGLKKDRKQILELLQRQGAVEITSGLEEDSIFRKTDVSSSKTVFEGAFGRLRGARDAVIGGVRVQRRQA